MKILITYASAGAGHRKAAEAIYNCLKARSDKVEVGLIDVLDKCSGFFRFNYTFGYSYLVNHLPLVWQCLFKLTSIRILAFFIQPLARIINQLNSGAFSKFLVQDRPDFIISTHFLPSQIVSCLKNTKKINSKLVTVITDFKVHPFWINKGTDVYAVASGFTKKILVSKGIREEAIREFGIPIDAKFLNKYDRGQLSGSLHIAKNKFTILIVTGSFGTGPIEEIIELLHKDVQILAVCARNKKLFIRLKNKKYDDLKVYGFIDNIEELMAVSDIIVTKPGGMSISELLAQELVPIFISPIPGQETGNIEALEFYGVGVEAKDAEEVKRIVLDYKSRPDKLNNIREIIKKIKKPNAAQELCDALCQGNLRAAS